MSEKFTLSPAAAGNFVIGLSSPMYCAKITADGVVFIDWKATENAAANLKPTDAMTLAIVRLMLAIRDGTFKPLE
jgi:hypothetical protein